MTAELNRPGHTRIRARALKNLTQYASSECLGLDPKEVEVKLQDSNTKLGVNLRTGIREDDVQRLTQDQQTTLFTFADETAREIVAKLSALSGYEIGETNLRFTHIVETEEKKRRVQ